MVVENLWGTTKMKKKLLFVGVFLTLALWLITDRSPVQLLVSFLAAGALPVVNISFSPYIMFGLAFLSGIALIIAFPLFDVRLPLVEEHEAQLTSVKITANTHRRQTKSTAKKSQAKRKAHHSKPHPRNRRVTTSKVRA